MTPFFIGITGGSGSGKTALAKELKKHFKKKASIFHIDNYQKFEGRLPKIYGMKNWDHPKSIDWNRLLKDLVSLKKNKVISIKSRDQEKLKRTKEIVFIPSKIIIIEGYLLFHKAPVRNLLDFCVYLETNNKTRIKRRTKFKNAKYIKKILLPMHYKYIEPMRKFANLILDTEKYSVKQCCKQIIQHCPVGAKSGT